MSDTEPSNRAMAFVVKWHRPLRLDAFGGKILAKAFDEATRQPDQQVTALKADNERLREALRRCDEIVEQWNGRQNEKVEDVRYIARNALNAWEQSNG
jgi:F0F1-type ATP synthase membrane subunit b/b'